MRDQGRPQAPGRNAKGAKAGGPKVGLMHFMSLAAAAAAAPGAALADTTISDSRTTGVTTQTVNNGAADNIIIASGGRIDVSTGAAVTINSDHDVTNTGTIGSEDDSNTTGVLILGPVTADLVNNGTIELDETYNPSDSDNDGDLDGQFAQGTNRWGVILQGGAMTGNITFATGSRITIEGNNSGGLRLDSILNGNLSALGTISVLGDNSIGIDVNNTINGDVQISGQITAQGANSVGVDIGGAVNGDVRINGSIMATGFRSTTRPTSTTALAALDADDLLTGGSGLVVRSNVTGGVLLDGTGVEDDSDDDGDGVPEVGPDTNSSTDDDANDDLGGTIQSYGSAPAVLITTNGANTTLGAIVDARTSFAGLNYGFANRGAIIAGGVYDNFEVYGVRIEGAGGNTVNVTGGILNDGLISVGARQADATGILIGQDATVPTILNRNRILSATFSGDQDTAYGVRLTGNANVATFDNRGSVEVQANGDEANAVAFIDTTGNVDTIVNSGSITAIGVPDTDSTFTGDLVAIDVSANTTGVTLTQIPEITFTDDDTTDSTSFDVLIVGDVLFGSGADVFDIQAGTVDGDVAFGAGADQLFIDGGAIFTGMISDSDGALTIDVQDGELGLTGGTLNLTNANFGAESVLRISISGNPGESTLFNASGTVTFADGAIVAPVLIEGLPDDGAVVFLTAGNLVGGNFVERELTGAGIPFIYNIAIAVSAGDPNALEARYDLKTAAELGLNVNEEAAFDSVLTALRLDDVAATAFGSLDSQQTFSEALNDLLPNFSAASTELAITGVAQGQGATGNRLAAVRLSSLDSDSFWIQEIGFNVQRDAPGFGVDYEGTGFGFAAGFDAPLANGLYLGLSAAFTTSDVEQDGRDGQISANLGQVNAYLGGAAGPFEWDLIAGIGAGRIESERNVAFGSFAATAEADWIAYEAHGMAQVGMPIALNDRFTITPRANIVFIGLQEEDHEEEGGGPAIDLAIGESTTSRMWSDAAFDVSWRFGTPEDFEITPKLTLGYRFNVLDDAAERDVQFVSGGAPFTLIDEEIGDGGPIAGVALIGGNDHTQISLNYQGEFGDTIERHSVNAAVRIRF